MDNLFSAKEKSKELKVDLHMHTIASDGTWSPENLLKNLLGAGIKIFAVTDHDSTDSLAQSAALAKEYGLGFINGVEVNTTFNHRNYHLLGLGINPDSQELQVLLRKNQELMVEKDNDSIKYLESKHSCVSFNEYTEYVNNPGRGGWKTLNYVIDKKLCTSYEDFFGLFDKWGNPYERLIFASPGQAIKAINLAGGVPILAHPGAGFYDKDYRTILSYMIDEGIRGIECYHPDNSPEITSYCLEICQWNNLLVTGGSDCHGEFVPARCLGRPEINFSQLKLDGIQIF